MHRVPVAVVAATLTIGIAVATATTAGADPNALWTIVDGQCVPDQIQHDEPAPCASVDLDGGYAVLKDLVGQRQFLLIPTGRVTGIESPDLLAPGAPNYFADAWHARYLVEQRAQRSLPPDWMSLAINSALARSQDQLHIHIDCLRPDVHAALARDAGSIGTVWAPFPVPLAGAPYQAIKVADLNSVDVFVLLADGVPGAREDMGSQTLVVTGSPDGDGFIALAGHADPATGAGGHGEDLQDHESCQAPSYGK
ncbi:CDP-diacylglycerol diphosphatase [Mycolicibacterium moriokaense]|nr:CDP-diacylglycerol diphosphatase [Mycolicibacterium moriokaense]